MYDRACLHLSEREIRNRLERGDTHTIRLKIPPGKTVVKDLLRGYVQFAHSTLDDQVMRIARFYHWILELLFPIDSTQE